MREDSDSEDEFEQDFKVNPEIIQTKQAYFDYYEILRHFKDKEL